MWLRRFGTTTLTGLTANPLVLSSPHALTYLPLHHNFGAQVVVEPRCDLLLAADDRAALVAADVAFVVFLASAFDPGAADELHIVGLDGRVRRPD